MSTGSGASDECCHNLLMHEEGSTSSALHIKPRQSFSVLVTASLASGRRVPVHLSVKVRVCFSPYWSLLLICDCKWGTLGRGQTKHRPNYMLGSTEDPKRCCDEFLQCTTLTLPHFLQWVFFFFIFGEQSATYYCYSLFCNGSDNLQKIYVMGKLNIDINSWLWAKLSKCRRAVVENKSVLLSFLKISEWKWLLSLFNIQSAYCQLQGFYCERHWPLHVHLVVTVNDVGQAVGLCI